MLLFFSADGSIAFSFTAFEKQISTYKSDSFEVEVTYDTAGPKSASFAAETGIFASIWWRHQ